MMQRHHWLHPLPATFAEDSRILVQRSVVEARRLTAVTVKGGLHPAPFNAHAEGVEPHPAAPLKVLLIAIPKIRCLPTAGHILALLRQGPVCLGLPRPVIATFGLVGRGGHAP